MDFSVLNREMSPFFSEMQADAYGDGGLISERDLVLFGFQFPEM